ncbi:hypothetical protein [Acaryochloris sp. IP29b_bin.148]|uniref:hypothetical protein n=1 Tax=Acaryochloris sp. IP29b_bin.148 TaxID=2969218 RepID=UPI002613D649|nr:hypothetical protein [Acaryochloris sp. IP29b_bin.148]
MFKPSVISKGGLTALVVLMSTPLFWACNRVPIVRRLADVQDQATDPKPDKVLQAFESIPGTPYLVANIAQVKAGKSRISSSEFYSRQGGGIANLVFLDSGSLESHSLFDTNQYTIVEAKQYPLDEPAPNPEAKKIKKTARFVYQVLKKDTNGDKYLDSRDHRTIAISDAFGKQYVEVLTDISQLFNLQPLTGNRLLVVYVKNGTKMVSIIDLSQRKVIQTSNLTKLEDDVE